MEREEPHMGRPDLSDIRFNDRIGVTKAPEERHSLWWQVALGVFIALMAHSMVVGAYRRYETQQATEQLNAEMKKLNAQWQREAASDAAAIQRTTTRYPTTAPRARPAPLLDGQRCMQGRRFQRVENGWIHLPSQPC